MANIGYFYLYRGFVLGESFDWESEPHYSGHAEFWEREVGKLFPTSPEVKELRLSWYGCDRGRITELEGRFQLLGTPAVFKNSKDILTLFKHLDLASVIRIESDEHYRISNGDAKVLKRNGIRFRPRQDFKYLIGRIGNVK
jgi:hypothetical protein